VPRKIVSDQLRSYQAAKAGIAELANVKHAFVRASARVNIRAENSHQPTDERKRRILTETSCGAPHRDFLRGMCGFRDPEHTQRFLSSFGPIRQHHELRSTANNSVNDSPHGIALMSRPKNPSVLQADSRVPYGCRAMNNST
jgi:hypothetical protein